ncbi:MAG TPA: retropepsin-like aspartic protease [Thermoplasmata archaeon]|nr:retropepsin-like aspartic protease [Thermoplasmata archaeon]
MAEHLVFRFTELRIDQFSTQRPLLDVKLSGPLDAVTIKMLVDSGSDVSMIQRELAEHLGLPMENAERTRGTAGGLEAFRTQVQAEIFHGKELLPPLDLPVQVPAERGLPPIALLGREVFFYRYDISFRMDHAPAEGTFVLSPVTGRRDAGDDK